MSRTDPDPKRVLVLGGTGTIGRAAVRALRRRGHEAVCFVRPPREGRPDPARLLPGAELRLGDVTRRESILHDGLRGERFNAILSCLASRTGAPRDAWAIDHGAHMAALGAAQAAGIGQFVLLSAICVQKPLLAFQKAKLAFEAALQDSGLTYSIVRPTAFFKSLSGQVARVKAGKPFLLFGDGRLTACRPISDDDLGDYLAGCLDDPERRNRILPIGGPGPAITPRDQADYLFAKLGVEPRVRHVPVAMMDAIIAVLSALGRVSPRMADKAEFARIGRYYATESMLVLDPETGRYDADATPEAGRETLLAHYDRMLAGEAGAELGEHAVF